MSDLRNKLVKLAYEKEELREDLLPLLKESDEDDPCWDGYEMVGMKEDENGKKVPNCVPKKESSHDAPSYMSEGNLKQLAIQSIKLLKAGVDKNKPLEDWMEAHITEAASKLDSVFHKIMYGGD